MCGIAGILRWRDAPTQDEIEEMTRAVAHRGPDGEGFHLQGPVALGHRRLAIIDLESGQQPLSNEDGSIWVTYNGEIYNFQELRKQLEGHGHTFRTHSDTEVIVHAYEQWGPEAVTRFRGMFAFAVADFARGRLFLARDHFGIKPLFYRLGSGFLAFGSELTALHKVRALSPRGRVEALEFYLRYRFIPGPETIFEDVYQLPPASWLEADFSGRLQAPVTYWRVEFRSDERIGEDEWLERFEATLRDSVRAHLVADVPFGVFLSGGIDSTLVAATMSKLLERPVTAFSIGFDEEQYTEVPYAREAAETLGITLRAEFVHLDVAHLLPELVAHYGQPFADTSMIPTWYVSRLARAEVPMVLSGDGGDEAFAGYPRYEAWVRDGILREFLALLASPRGVFWRVPRLLNRIGNGSAQQLLRWEDWISNLSTPLRTQLWRPEYRHLVHRRCPAYVKAAEESRGLDTLSVCQYLDFQTYLPGDILTKVDVASMYHGLEVRPPLIDTRVVSLAASLPASLRYRRRGSERVLKWLPKRSLRKTFPEPFVNRPKMGFGIPEDRWLRQGSPVRALFDELVLRSDSPLWNWFQRPAVERWVLDLDRGGQPRGSYLWAILILALWLERMPGISFAPLPTDTGKQAV